MHLGKKKNVVSVFLVEFIRIRTVISWCAFSCGAFILGMSSLSISEYLGRFLIFFVSTFCILSFTFAINNYYDVDSDRINPKKIHFNAIAEGRISKKTGSLVNLTLVVIAFLTVALLSNLGAFVFCILFIFWMWAYSAPPLRLKGRPGVDIIWHFIAFVILVLWGSFIAGSLGVSNWLAAISLGVFSCVAQVWNHFNDYEFDKREWNSNICCFSRTGYYNSNSKNHRHSSCDFAHSTNLSLLVTVCSHNWSFHFRHFDRDLCSEYEKEGSRIVVGLLFSYRA